MPRISYPCSLSTNAQTAESTPPLNAICTRLFCACFGIDRDDSTGLDSESQPYVWLSLRASSNSERRRFVSTLGAGRLPFVRLRFRFGRSCCSRCSKGAALDAAGAEGWGV